MFYFMKLQTSTTIYRAPTLIVQLHKTWKFCNISSLADTRQQQLKHEYVNQSKGDKCTCVNQYLWIWWFDTWNIFIIITHTQSSLFRFLCICSFLMLFVDNEAHMYCITTFAFDAFALLMGSHMGILSRMYLIFM